MVGRSRDGSRLAFIEYEISHLSCESPFPQEEPFKLAVLAASALLQGLLPESRPHCCQEAPYSLKGLLCSLS